MEENETKQEKPVDLLPMGKKWKPGFDFLAWPFTHILGEDGSIAKVMAKVMPEIPTLLSVKFLLNQSSSIDFKWSTYLEPGAEEQ